MLAMTGFLLNSAKYDRELSVMMRVIGALLAVLVAGGLARADFQFQDWWFDRDQPGQLPSGFALGSSNVGSGRWEVRADSLSSSPPNVLAHISSDQEGLSPQVLFLEKVEAANLELSVRIKAAQDGEGQGSGVIFRAQDDRNYYVVWLSPRENLVRLDKVVNGQAQTLQEIQVETKPGTWPSLRLSIRVPILEAFLNKRFLSAREVAWESGRYNKGKLGLVPPGARRVYGDHSAHPQIRGSGESPARR